MQKHVWVLKSSLKIKHPKSQRTTHMQVCTRPQEDNAVFVGCSTTYLTAVIITVDGKGASMVDSIFSVADKTRLFIH